MHGRRRITPTLILEIEDALSCGESHDAIAERLEVTPYYVSRLAIGRRPRTKPGTKAQWWQIYLLRIRGVTFPDIGDILGWPFRRVMQFFYRRPPRK